MIKTILVPTDASEHAEKARELATDIAQKYDARILFLHSVQDRPLSEGLRRMAEAEHIVDDAARAGIASIPEGKFPANIENVDDGARRKVLEFVGQQILRRAETAAKEAGVERVEGLLEFGDPVKSILATAKREEANIIVMGSRGLSDLKGLMVGSVSHKVSNLAPCTCVTVR